MVYFAALIETSNEHSKEYNLDHMKKIYSTFLTILTAGALLTVSAQQQPNNGGFEIWDATGGEPTNWNNMTSGDLCLLCVFGSTQRVFKDVTEFRSGLSSARIESTAAAGNTINGTMTTGQIKAPDTNPLNGYSFTKRADALFNHPFTEMPDSLLFYAKYNLTDATDSASISVVLHDDNDYREPGGNAAQVIATAKKRFQTGGTANWVRISVPFVYDGMSTNAIAYALMTFTASYEPGAGNSTAKLWVDDFEFIYNPIDPTSVQEIANEVAVYPNPTNDGRITVSLGADFRTGNATVFNVMGQTVGTFNFFNSTNVNVEINQPAGMYFINVRTEDGQQTTVRAIKN